MTQPSNLEQDLTFTSPLVESTEVCIDKVPTDYTVILGYHGAPIDMPSSLRDIYASADVVLHECIGWHPDEEKIYNQLSFASKTAQPGLIEAARRRYFDLPLSMKRIRLVAGTQASHSFWDVPAGHPAVPRLSEGRTLTPYTPQEVDQFTSAAIEADVIALQSLKDRILSVQPDMLKNDKRRVVLHAGMAHVLLYNALRLVTEQSETSTTSLHIPFEHTGLGLADQVPSVLEAVAAVKGEQISPEEADRYLTFNKLDSLGNVPKAASHKYAITIWELINSRT